MPEILTMPDADVVLYRQFFAPSASDLFFQALLHIIAWEQAQVTLYGRVRRVPRLTAWYGDAGKSYTYSGMTHHPHAWTPLLRTIKRSVEAVVALEFNTVLLNFYRDGQDSVAWHSDDEPELGRHPVIASVSFGATRPFQFKHKQQRTLRTSVELTHGSLLLMQGPTQQHWLHRIPKTARPLGPRINLTFRVIQ